MEVLKNKQKSGFTLIELLVVIGIIAILAAAVIIAVNPARQFGQARNTQRRTDVLAILNAVHQNAVDNRGNFDFAGCETEQIPATAQPIARDDGDPLTDEYDICDCIVPTYVSLLPLDPTDGSGDQDDCSAVPGYATGYEIVRDANGRITVSAPSASTENPSETIKVTR